MSPDDTIASQVVVLDAAASVVGAMDKLAAHGRPATPHLAFSVVLFDPSGATLLQRRAAGKYHFPGRWSNACCSHPRPGEGLRAAARRRLAEELRIHGVDLEIRGAFWYQADDPLTGLSEHEFDVVFAGTIDGDVRPEPEEVSAVALRDPADVLAACRNGDGQYTPWLRAALEIALGPPQPVPDHLPL